VPRELQANQIKIYSHNGAFAAQRGQVPADAAAQVGHQGARRVARGAVGGGDLRRGLLQPVPGEQHRVRPAELGPGRGPQRLLGERRGDQAGRVAAAQGPGQLQRAVRADLLAGQPVEQLASGDNSPRVKPDHLRKRR
jgi:hypothetical protein